MCKDIFYKVKICKWEKLHPYFDKNRNVIQQIFTEPVWKRENRPYYTKAKDKTSSDKIEKETGTQE